jgi:hypothetical protein
MQNLINKLKTILLITILSGIGFGANATTSLRVQNPDYWSSQYGEMENIALEIYPQGIYTQVNVYITFNDGLYQNYYYAELGDSIEVQYFFDLPSDALVTDSWLWVDDEVVIADIQNRYSAQETYEGIVNRRKDPSILYKNSATQYELRVYPLVSGESRKVMFTYLVPNTWSGDKVSTNIPLNFLNVNRTTDVHVRVHETADWSSPEISGYTNSAYSDTEDSYTYSFVPESDLGSSLTISYDNPSVNGVYIQTFQKSDQEKYYQLALDPQAFLTVQDTNHIAIVFDHVDYNTSHSQSTVWNETREALKVSLNEHDYFNIFYTKFNTKSASDEWILATDDNIDSVFNEHWNSSPLSSHSNISSAIGTVIDFMDEQHQDGEILFVSSSSDYSNYNESSQFIDDYNSLNSPYELLIANYRTVSNYNVGYFYLSGTYYYGNDYLYNQIAVSSNGSHEKIGGQDFRSFISDMINSTSTSIETFDVSLDIGYFGFNYAEYEPNGSELYLNSTFTQIGKYIEEGDFRVKLVAEYNGEIHAKSVTISNPNQDVDSATFQIWSDHYMNERSASGDLVDVEAQSISSRVLSTQTAFLALDPNEFDDVEVCDDCDYVSSTEDVMAESTIGLTVYPNPVEEAMNLTINLPQGYADLNAKVQLLSLDGIVLHEWGLAASDLDEELELMLNELGYELEKGTYLVNVQVGALTQSIRISKI